MPERQPKSGKERPVRIDEKPRERGNIEYEQAEGHMERQAPLEGPSRRAVNQSDTPGEIAENMGLNETFTTEEEDEEER